MNEDESKEAKLLKRFLNKNVRLITKREWTHIGTIIDVSDLGIIIDDRKKGEMFISIHDIKDITLYNENVNNDK